MTTALTLGALLVLFAMTGVEGWFLSRRRQVCHAPYGCYSNTAPFNQPYYTLPQSPAALGVRFRVYKTGRQPYWLTPGNLSGLQPQLPTKIIIHGYKNSAMVPWVTAMASSLLERDSDMNVVALDWQRGAASWNYYQAVANTRLVGAILADLLRRLQERGANPDTFHLIGHSLGAHTAGYAGRLRGNVGRITGLDPAGPAFYGVHTDVRLDPSDATYVDVIHTNDGINPAFGLGLGEPMGTSDFYVNGGSSQPGCQGFARVIACSHQRVLDLFIESIQRRGCFRAMRCSSLLQLSAASCHPCRGPGCPVMGYDSISSNARGIFFLSTNGRAPFCRGHDVDTYTSQARESFYLNI